MTLVCLHDTDGQGQEASQPDVVLSSLGGSFQAVQVHTAWPRSSPAEKMTKHTDMYSTKVGKGGREVPECIKTSAHGAPERAELELRWAALGALEMQLPLPEAVFCCRDELTLLKAWIKHSTNICSTQPDRSQDMIPLEAQTHSNLPQY